MRLSNGAIDGSAMALTLAFLTWRSAPLTWQQLVFIAVSMFGVALMSRTAESVWDHNPDLRKRIGQTLGWLFLATVLNPRAWAILAAFVGAFAATVWLWLR